MKEPPGLFNVTALTSQVNLLHRPDNQQLWHRCYHDSCPMLKTKKFQPSSTEFDLRDILLAVLAESCFWLDLQATHTGSLDNFRFKIFKWKPGTKYLFTETHLKLSELDNWIFRLFTFVWKTRRTL